jgi:hypothetical protein
MKLMKVVIFSLWFFALVMILAACETTPMPEPTLETVSPPTVEIITIQPSVTALPVDPTATEEPLAAVINGEGISLADFEAHLSRFRDAEAELGMVLASDNAEQRVLEDLINTMLLAQAARDAGFAVDESMVEERFDQLIEQAGGEEATAQWMLANYYTPQSFRSALWLEMESVWMRDQITSAVPETAEQVEARVVLLDDAYQAERLLNQLEDGTSFDIIVANYDPQERGYLGWFPRGYLLVPELEEVAFSLQPGDFSEVIETDHGYYILEVIDRNPNKQLSPDARLTLQMHALREWLDEYWIQSQIDIRIPKK